MNTDVLVSNFYTDLVAIDTNGKPFHTDITRVAKRSIIDNLTSMYAYLKTGDLVSKHSRPSMIKAVHESAGTDILKIYNLLHKSAYITTYCYRKYGRDLENMCAESIHVWGYAMRTLQKLDEYNIDDNVFTINVRSALDTKWRKFYVIIISMKNDPTNKLILHPVVIKKKSIKFNYVGSRIVNAAQFCMSADAIVPLKNFLFQNRDAIQMVGACVNNLRKH